MMHPDSRDVPQPGGELYVALSELISSETQRVWVDSVKVDAGAASSFTIYGAYNEKSNPIKIKSCVARSSGAVSTEGVTFFRDRPGRTFPVHHDKAALTALETAYVPFEFLLLPGERVGVTFDATAAATDILELVVTGLYTKLIEC
jgi:hypothetical protein